MFFIIIISFIAMGLIFFIKNASKMSKKYFLLTLSVGILSLSLISIGFINPRFGGFTGVILSQIAFIIYPIFFLMAILYPKDD